MKLKEIPEGKTKKTTVLVCAKAEKVTKNGKPYCELVVSDGEEKVLTKIWDTQEADLPDVPFLADCKITASIYNDTRDYKISDPMVSNGDIKDYIITAPIPSENMYKTIVSFVGDSFPDKYTIEGTEYDSLKVLGINLYEKYKNQLLYWAAAKSMHHNCYGGLLYHAYRMVLSAFQLSKVYKGIDVELLIIGAMIHDIGKLRELDTNVIGEAEYSIDGSLFGHALLGIEMINEESEKLNLHPEKLKMLKHMIASHHKNLDWGAISTPLIQEAMLLHYIDMIDADMYKFEEAKKLIEPGNLENIKIGIRTNFYVPNV